MAQLKTNKGITMLRGYVVMDFMQPQGFSTSYQGACKIVASLTKRDFGKAIVDPEAQRKYAEENGYAMYPYFYSINKFDNRNIVRC